MLRDLKNIQFDFGGESHADHDAHIHFSHIESFKQNRPENILLDYPNRVFRSHSRKPVLCAIGMGLTEQTCDGFPIKPLQTPCADLMKSRGMVICPGINPVLLQNAEYQDLEK